MRIIATQPALKDLAAVYAAPGLTDAITTPFWDETQPTQAAFDLGTFQTTIAAMPNHLGIVVAPTAGARAPAWLATLPDALIARNLFIAPAYHEAPRPMDVTAPYTPGYVSAYLAMHQALHDAMTPSQQARVTEVKPTAFGWLDNEMQIPWCSGKIGNQSNTAIWTALGLLPANLLDTYLYILDELRLIWGPAITLSQASWKPGYFLPCAGTREATVATWQSWLEAAAAAETSYQIIDTALGAGSINPAFLRAQSAGVPLAFQTQADLGSRHAILAATANGIPHGPTAIELHAPDIVRWPDLPAAVRAQL
jgi:hypothetical protein